MDIPAPRVKALGLIDMYRAICLTGKKQKKKKRAKAEGKSDEGRNSKRALEWRWRGLRPNPEKMVSLSF